MSYKDTLYWVRFISKASGHEITHAGMAWGNYHSLCADLTVKGIPYTDGEEIVTVRVVADEMGQAGGR